MCHCNWEKKNNETKQKTRGLFSPCLAAEVAGLVMLMLMQFPLPGFNFFDVWDRTRHSSCRPRLGFPLGELVLSVLSTASVEIPALKFILISPHGA